MHGLFPWKIKRVLQNILKESNQKPNKILVNKSREFYNRSKKSFLEKYIQPIMMEDLWLLKDLLEP